MKIENNYNKYLQAIQQTKKQDIEKKSAKEPEILEEKNIEVNISEEARKLAETSQKENRQARIEQIKNEIQKDEYQVDTQKITKGILEEIDQQRKD